MDFNLAVLLKVKDEALESFLAAILKHLQIDVLTSKGSSYVLHKVVVAFALMVISAAVEVSVMAIIVSFAAVNLFVESELGFPHLR